MQDGCLGSWLPPSRGEHRAVQELKKQKCGKHALPQAFHGLLCCGLCLIRYSWEGTSRTANSHPYFKNENTTTQRPRRSFSLCLWGWYFSSCFWTLEKTWFPGTCSDRGQRSFEELSVSFADVVFKNSWVQNCSSESEVSWGFPALSVGDRPGLQFTQDVDKPESQKWAHFIVPGGAWSIGPTRAKPFCLYQSHRLRSEKNMLETLNPGSAALWEWP